MDCCFGRDWEVGVFDMINKPKGVGKEWLSDGEVGRFKTWKTCSLSLQLWGMGLSFVCVVYSDII